MNKKLKEIFNKLYLNFPNGRINEQKLKTAIKTEADRNLFVKQGFLLEEKIDSKKYYNLGPNGLLIINSWKTERLNLELMLLTCILLFIALTHLFQSFGKVEHPIELIVPLLLAGILLAWFLKIITDSCVK